VSLDGQTLTKLSDFCVIRYTNWGVTNVLGASEAKEQTENTGTR
jgi:hypothetical protein